jgi:apolipoprotein N-acyltransferase
MVGLAIVAICWSWGVRTVRKASPGKGSLLRVVAIQPAIPQLQKWNETHEAEIVKALKEQTELALMCKPDLIVWPETATPGMLRIDPVSLRLLEMVANHGQTALLAGSMDYRQEDDHDPEYLNASFLISTNGQISASYNKRHLVLFGEILPFERQVPFIQRWSPLGFSCVPGEPDQPLMQLANPTRNAPPIPLSVLICFEDAFPYLARRDVRRGARLLINQTNDAWFDGSAASRQHMANAALRTVENRLPMVRAANTGITCFIDRFGRITERVLPSQGNNQSRGFSVASIRAGTSEMALTLYTRFGDWILGIPCAIATLLWMLWMWRSSHRARFRNECQSEPTVG